METAQLVTRLLCYLFEKFEQYPDAFTRTDGGPFRLLECGQRHEIENVFRNTLLESDGIRYRTHTAVFAAGSDWLAWQKRHRKEAEGIGLVITAEEDEDIGKYAAEPVIGLRGEVPDRLFDRINRIVSADGALCIRYLARLDEVVKQSILGRYAIERMENKRNRILLAHRQTGSDWNKTFIYMLFDSIAIANRRNRKNFNALARLIGYDTILRQLEDSVSIEALLFGTAGLLRIGRRHDEYTILLVRRFAELKKTYRLETMDASVWDFSYMNRDNTLWVVTAQLAMILLWCKDNFLSIAEELDEKEISELVSYGTSAYWYNHDQLSGEEHPRLGERIMSKNRRERLIINGIIPFLFAYYRSNGIYDNNEKLLDMLEKLGGETNRITRKWESCGIRASNAMLSQSVIEIEKTYCADKRCTECRIGRMMIGE